MTTYWAGTDLWYLTLQSTGALLFVAIGVYLPMRTGVLVLGAEGIMLFGCFGAVAAQVVTGAGAVVGVLGAIGASTAASALFAAVAITGRVNAVVTGIALNFIATGGTAVLTALLVGGGGAIIAPSLQALPRVPIPIVSSVPWAREVLSGQTAVLYAALAAVPLLALWLDRTRAGLTARVVGGAPRVAVEAGRSPDRTRWFALVAGGAFTGLGAAQLSLASVAQFSPGMTSGRGFIALALVLVAAARPWLLLPLAVVFAFFDTLGFTLQNIGLPTELSGVLPYVAIIMLLAVPSLVRRWAAVR